MANQGFMEVGARGLVTTHHVHGHVTAESRSELELVQILSKFE